MVMDCLMKTVRVGWFLSWLLGKLVVIIVEEGSVV